MPKLFYDDNGVSVIVGALLLILIVVIAAAGLAMIVSQAEKQQADRQTQEDAIKNENLKIISITPTYYYNDSVNQTSPLYGNLLSINITIQNLNTEDARIGQISLNDIYASKYTVGSSSYVPGTDWLTVPASKSVVIHLVLDTTDFATPPIIKNTDQIKVQVSTSYYNFFDMTFKPPVASAKFEVDTENLGLVQRDYIMLDGSDSTSETGTIKVYKWYIIDESGVIPPFTTKTSGSKIRFSPTSNGPFMITLSVMNNQFDDNAMIGTTDVMNIPTDPNFCPPLTLTAVYYQNNTTIVATLRDASNRLCSGNIITFQPGSTVQANQTMAITDNGTAAANVSFIGDALTGTVTVNYEKLSTNIQVTRLPTLPSADFQADSISGNAPFTVHFTDLSSGGTYGSITAWQWDFGDGLGNDTTKNPTHTYSSSGTYSVTLTVSNNGGTSTKSKPNYITVHNTAPVANFYADITNGSKPLTVNFTDTSMGVGITSWSWTFGNGNTDNSPNPPVQTYSSPGDYTVILTVVNDGGSNTSTKTNYIHVI